MQRVLFRMINKATLGLLILALFLSLQSVTLSPWTLNNRFYVIMFLGLILLYIATLFPTWHVAKKAWLWVASHNNRLFWLLLAILTIWQITLFMTLQTQVSSDAQIILSGLTQPKTLAHYLSINPNNTMYFFMSFLMSKIIGTQLWAFKLATLVIIDISVLLFRLFVKTYFDSRSLANITTLIFSYFVMLQPIFILPYTDNYGLIFTGLALVCLVNGLQSSIWQYGWMIGAGLSIALLYLLRPSAIIFIIAFGLFMLISPKGLGIKKSMKTTALLLLTCLSIFGLTTVVFNAYVEKQHIIKIDKSKGFPAVHFILLGSYGNPEDKHAVHGTFNESDYGFAIAYPNKKAREKPEFNRFLDRTKQRGFGESLKFYVMKYSDNIDTGVMGSHREQLWSTVSSLEQKNATSKKLQHMIYQHNIKVGDRVTWNANFQFFLQLIWLVILIGMIYTTWVYQDNPKTTLIALSLLGGLLFLLIFESGGTKYMIQYTPFISMLAGFGLYQLYQNRAQS